MGVELAGSGQAGGNADTGAAGEPRGEKHRDGLARKVEGAHHAAAGVAEELHDAEEIQHVREHEGHQHVRQQAVETDVETLAQADDEDVEGILRGGGVISHFRSPCDKRC